MTQAWSGAQLNIESALDAYAIRHPHHHKLHVTSVEITASWNIPNIVQGILRTWIGLGPLTDFLCVGVEVSNEDLRTGEIGPVTAVAQIWRLTPASPVVGE